MTEATIKQVLENLRRIDWKAAALESRSPYIATDDYSTQIRQQVKDTIELIEQDRNKQP